MQAAMELARQRRSQVNGVSSPVENGASSTPSEMKAKSQPASRGRSLETLNGRCEMNGRTNGFSDGRQTVTHRNHHLHRCRQCNQSSSRFVTVWLLTLTVRSFSAIALSRFCGSLCPSRFATRSTSSSAARRAGRSSGRASTGSACSSNSTTF